MCEHQRLWTQINSVVRIGSGQEGKATRCSITVADLPLFPVELCGASLVPALQPQAKLLQCAAVLFHPGHCTAPLHLTQGSAMQEGREQAVCPPACLCQCQHDPAPGKTSTSFLHPCKVIHSLTKANAEMKAKLLPLCS